MSVRIELRHNENIDSALRRLRRSCTRAGLARGRRAKRFYEKPSERRRRKAKERLITIRRADRMRRNA